MGFLTLFLDPKKKGQLGLLLLILVLFCLMTGNGPGTVRATVLCAMALLAQQLGQDYHSLTGLCAALLVLLAANPYAAANAGLQFSFLSTLGILLFGQRWSKAWLAQVPKGARRWAAPFRGGRDQSGGHGVYRAAVCRVFWAVFPHRPLTNLMTSWAVTLAFVGGALSVAVGAVVFPLGQGLAALVGFPSAFSWAARPRPAGWAWPRWTWTGGTTPCGPCLSMAFFCCICWRRCLESARLCRCAPAW